MLLPGLCRFCWHVLRSCCTSDVSWSSQRACPEGGSRAVLQKSFGELATPPLFWSVSSIRKCKAQQWLGEKVAFFAIAVPPSAKTTSKHTEDRVRQSWFAKATVGSESSNTESTGSHSAEINLRKRENRRHHKSELILRGVTGLQQCYKPSSLRSHLYFCPQCPGCLWVSSEWQLFLESGCSEGTTSFAL